MSQEIQAHEILGSSNKDRKFATKEIMLAKLLTFAYLSVCLFQKKSAWFESARGHGFT